MHRDLKTDGYYMRTGKHKGERITRVPVSYLMWMVNAGHGEAERAAQELKRRGTTFPTLELSGHAIDRASIRLERLWKRERNEGEGIYHWLHGRAEKAWEYHQKRNGGSDVFDHEGVRWAFAVDGVWPVLKSVMAPKGRPSRKTNATN